MVVLDDSSIYFLLYRLSGLELGLIDLLDFFVHIFGEKLNNFRRAHIN